MSNILLSEQNKELLWNILSNNKAFVNIPESKFPNIKAIFESNITKIFNENKEIFITNYKTGDSKNIIMQLNKTILQNIMLDINSFKKSLLRPLDIKNSYKNEKSEDFDKELQEKKVSFTNLMTNKVPKAIDFSETKDVPLENDSMNELLERIQKERNSDIPIPKNLELVDLNKFDVSLSIEDNINYEENIDTRKTKIINIEDLISGLTNATAITENNKTISRENNTLKKFITSENNNEFNLNLNIKIDFLNKQIEKVLSNQNLIMTKLNI